jgi:hypothetical protein
MRHRRVVFGLTSSPFHLAATLRQLLRNAPPEVAETTSRLARGLYVDNIVTSLDTPTKLRTFVDEASRLLASHGFEVRDWEEATEAESACSPLLGMTWDRVSDTLACETKSLDQRRQDCPSVTKRVILSVAQAVFDPVGHTTPATVTLKILLQRLWRVKIGWDDAVDETTEKAFRRWLTEAEALKHVKLPRWIGSGDRTLHAFCDASRDAYAAVVFVRTESAEGVQVHLVAAKARVSPLEELTIPRLELLGCLIATRLVDEVKTNPDCEDVSCKFWTDSTVARAWIQKEGRVWNAFVGNRVKEIRQRSSPQEWRHVPGEANPADLPSRGCSPQALADSKWWLGPPWLRESPDNWPPDDAEPENLDEIYRERMKGADLSLVAHAEGEGDPPDWILGLGERFSNFRKVVRVVGWVQRYVRNLGVRRRERVDGELRQAELEEAEGFLWKAVQQQQFKDEVRKLTAGEPLIAKSRLFELRPFLGAGGLVRSRTRIVEAEDTEEFRLPLIVGDCRLLRLKILDVHRNLLHAGPSTVLTHLRETMWLLQGRQTVRKSLRACGGCRRFSARPLTAEEAPLPRLRLQAQRAFESTGVDLAGPVHLRPGRKTARQRKAWIVLFTCAVYRAVHLEVVPSLSTPDFLLAFRRFVARRGRPRHMWSDNGTNFVGAIRAFQGAVQPLVWQLNPPAAPWWGGFWERLVRSLKDALRKTVGKALLTEQELYTVLCEVESVVNLRPLTPTTEDPEDFAALTPAVFLGGPNVENFPEADQADAHLKGRAAYRLSVSAALRRRFRAEYLGALRTRGTVRGARTPKPGDVGLLGADGHKRLGWPLCRVEAVFPGRDGVVRTIRVRMPGGSRLLRPVQRFHWLEATTVESDEPVDGAAAASDGAAAASDEPVAGGGVPVAEVGRLPTVQSRRGRSIRLPRRLLE